MRNKKDSQPPLPEYIIILKRLLNEIEEEKNKGNVDKK